MHSGVRAQRCGNVRPKPEEGHSCGDDAAAQRLPLPKTPDKRALGLADVMIWQQWARIQVSDVKRCAYDLEGRGKGVYGKLMKVKES
jgi:hypothetical protein